MSRHYSRVLCSAFTNAAANEIKARVEAGKSKKVSELQQNVANAVNQPDSFNISVQAVAGSGKTSTLINVLQSITYDELVIYNTHKIATQLGMLTNAIGKYRPSPYAFSNYLGYNPKEQPELPLPLLCDVLFEEYSQGNTTTKPNFWDLRYKINRLSELIRLELVDYDDPKAISELADFHGISFNSMAKLIYPWISLHLGIYIDNLLDVKKINKSKFIDFADMLFLPIHSNKKSKVFQEKPFDLILVDEGQDYSNAQMELVNLTSNKRTRWVFFWDKQQSVMGFAGANVRQVDIITERLNLQPYLLNVNYRCPTGVIKLAKKYNPEIEPCDFAPEGEIFEIEGSEVIDLVKAGDMVICRSIAPMVALAISGITKRIPIKVKGRDIIKTLEGHVIGISQSPGFSYGNFTFHCKDYFMRKVEALRKRAGTENVIDTLLDSSDALIHCYESFPYSNSCKDLITELKSLFDDKSALVLCQTFHSAKGQENNKVFILSWDKSNKSTKKSTDEQKQQELNASYVALTRCKFDLNDPESGKLYLCESKSI